MSSQDRENTARLDWHGQPLANPDPPRHPGRLRRQIKADEIWLAQQMEINQALLDHLVGFERIADALENAIGSPRRRIQWSGTAVIAANGQWMLNLRQPSRAIWVTSYNGNGQLVVAAAPPQGAAPGAGPGTHLLPSAASQVFHGETNDWTLYGTPGNSFNVQIFGVPVQPFAGSV